MVLSQAKVISAIFLVTVVQWVTKFSLTVQWVPTSAAAASLENLLETQMLGSLPRLTESETLGLIHSSLFY